MTGPDVRRLAAFVLPVFVVALAAAAPAQGQEPREEDVRQRTSRRQAQPDPASDERPGLRVAHGRPAHAQAQPAPASDERPGLLRDGERVEHAGAAQPDPASDERPGILERLADFTGGRFQMHVNGAYQYFSRRSEIPNTFRAYGEEARFLTRQEFRGGAHVDAGGAWRVWRELALGASYSQVTNAGAAVVTGTVPHPLETRNDRRVPRQTLALAQRQRAMHVYAAWRVPLRDTLEVDFSAGPTYFNLRRGVVANLIPAEASGPPFPDVELRVETGEHTRNGFGYNAGVDVTFLVTPVRQVLHVGVGWFVRVSGGSVAWPSAAGSERTVPVGGFQTGAAWPSDAGSERTVPVGGFQTGAGLRLRF